MTLELPRRYSFRYVELKVIDTSPKWRAVFYNPVVTSENSADMTKIKKPEIKDERLARIYQVGLKTLADCMQDVYLKTVRRETDVFWLGDFEITGSCKLCNF